MFGHTIYFPTVPKVTFSSVLTIGSSGAYRQSHVACLPLKASVDIGLLHCKALSHCPASLPAARDRAPTVQKRPQGPLLDLACNTSPLLDVSALSTALPLRLPHQSLCPKRPWRQEEPGELSELSPSETWGQAFHHFQHGLLQKGYIPNSRLSSEFGTQTVWLGECAYLHQGREVVYTNYCLTAEWALNIFFLNNLILQRQETAGSCSSTHPRSTLLPYSQRAELWNERCQCHREEG